jgi:hypothetical protein
VLPIAYEANFVSAIANATTAIGDDAGGDDKFTAEIDDLLGRAQVAYAQQAYRDAISFYKQVQSRIFTLLNPSHPVWRHVVDDHFLLPVGATFESKVAEAGLKLAEVAQPSTQVALPPVGVSDTPLAADTTRFDRIGYVLGGGVPPNARLQAELGADLLRRGFADQATSVLVSSLQALNQAQSPDAKALAASVALDLSNAHLAAGQPTEAQSVATVAQKLFAGVDNAAGQVAAVRTLALAQTAKNLSTIASNGGNAAVEAAADSGVVAPPSPPPPAVAATWSWFVPVGTAVRELQWTNGVRPDTQTLLDAVYAPRVAATTIADLAVYLTGTGETNAYLTHIYSFVLPQALGDCYSQLGQYDVAETYYLQAAGYSYLNTSLEAPSLWTRLADNTLRWGDSLYRAERVDDCKPVYAKLITQAGAAGDSPLYTLAAFAGPAADAKTLITNLAAPQAAAVNPAIARPILSAWARWQYLSAGLDFFGTTFTPILTFEYLQQAATEFAQRAVQAEREYVDFQSRSEAGAATRRELQSAAAMANAAVAAQDEQWQAAQHDASAADAAVHLANVRATDAANDKAAYAVDGYWQYVSQSIAAAHAAGSDWYGDEIRQLAANMEAGSWSGESGKLAAAATLLGGEKSYEYQLGRLQDTIDEMNATVPIAQQQAAAAHDRAESARLQYEASLTHAQLSNDALAAFDNDVFTPDVWSRMALVMRGLSGDYLDSAIRTAKLMEHAYNFENDDSASVIRTEYLGVGSADGLFGGDFLLRDIDSFTYRFIASQRAKQSQLKDVISLANQYPFDFQRFKQTGLLTFETTLHDADMRHPGFYEQRLAGVEVEVIGLLPPEGVQGALTAGGVSRYRTADGGERTRIHTVDTLALSEYSLRDDGLVFRVDPRIHGLFEGHGIATTWTLDLPRRSNNLDYRLITDVRIVLYYAAFYDGALHNSVLSAPPKPGEMIHVRSLLLRFDFPEIWYSLLDNNEATFTVTPEYLPRNETNFVTQTIAVVLETPDGVSPANVGIELTPPGKAVAAMTTGADGRIAADAGTPLAAQLGAPVLGDWHIAVRPPAGSPLLDADGKLDDGKIDQISLLLQYQFDWP